MCLPGISLGGGGQGGYGWAGSAGGGTSLQQTYCGGYYGGGQSSTFGIGNSDASNTLQSGGWFGGIASYYGAGVGIDYVYIC